MGEKTLVDSEFRHPLLMNIFMFTGEAVLLLVLKLKHSMAKDPSEAIIHA